MSIEASCWSILPAVVNQTRRILWQESTKTLQDDNTTLNRIDDCFRNILRSKTIISTILHHDVCQSVPKMICSRLATKKHDETTVARNRKVWSLWWLTWNQPLFVNHQEVIFQSTLLFHTFWSRSDCFAPECQFLFHPDMMTQRFMRLRSPTRSHLQQNSHRVPSTRKSSTCGTTNIRDTAGTWMHWVHTSWKTPWCACIYCKTFARFAARREGGACFLWAGSQSAFSSVLFQHSGEHAPCSSAQNAFLRPGSWAIFHLDVRKFVVQTLWRAGLPRWSLGRQTYFLLRFSWLCLPTWHLSKSLWVRTSHTIAQNLSISADPLTNQFFTVHRRPVSTLRGTTLQGPATRHVVHWDSRETQGGQREPLANNLTPDN